ncbi:MAG: PEP/pyruvate-binding domain-containing protein, partial [Pseudoalteromonas tetraodonis]|nr:PEP/pyruvate-binding domain-containing protein [Pseudoalteromonas tetraodonis]
MQEYVLWYQELGMQDVPRVGGKNASLGEMISNLANAGVQVPGGFATTSDAFNEFLEQSGLNAKIHDILDTLDVDDVNTLAKVGADIRQWIIDRGLWGTSAKHYHLDHERGQAPTSHRGTAWEEERVP